ALAEGLGREARHAPGPHGEELGGTAGRPSVSLESLPVPTPGLRAFLHWRAAAVCMPVAPERELVAERTQAGGPHDPNPPDDAARRKLPMLGWFWAPCAPPGGLDDDPGAPGAAGPAPWDPDEDPPRLGAGLKKQVCSWEAHT